MSVELPEELTTKPYLFSDGEGYRKNVLKESVILSEVVERLHNKANRADEYLGWRIQMNQCVRGWVKGVKRVLEELVKAVKAGDAEGSASLYEKAWVKLDTALERAGGMDFKHTRSILEQFYDTFRQLEELMPPRTPKPEGRLSE